MINSHILIMQHIRNKSIETEKIFRKYKKKSRFFLFFSLNEKVTARTY